MLSQGIDCEMLIGCEKAGFRLASYLQNLLEQYHADVNTLTEFPKLH
jgi:hypothetical protein